MKKKLTSINSVLILLVLLLIAISMFFPEYTRYFLYFSLIVMPPVMIVDLIKKKRQDKINVTTEFQLSIYRMLFMAVVLGSFFLITKVNYI